MSRRNPGAGNDRPRARAGRTNLVAVAAAVGVSPSTVSNAYNRPDQLSPSLRTEILRVAAQLGYPGPDPLARNLRRGRTGAIGVVFSEPLPYPFEDQYAIDVLKGMAERLSAEADDAGEQFALLFVPGSVDPHTHGHAIRSAAIDGLVLHSLHDDDPRVHVALARKIPTVIIDAPDVAGVDLVGVDDRRAVAAATAHLIALGHTRLAALSFRLTGHAHTGPVTGRARGITTASVVRARIEGFETAIRDAGLDPARASVQECASISAEAGRAATAQLLDRAPATTAIVAFSDLLAIGGLHAAADRGLSVPADLSIVGFDDVPAAAAHVLTTVRQPRDLKGRLAASRLIEAIGNPVHESRHQLLDTELVIRGSAAPPRPAAAGRMP